jgi:DnaJ-class molecular chaperone
MDDPTLMRTRKLKAKVLVDVPCPTCEGYGDPWCGTCSGLGTVEEYKSE